MSTDDALYRLVRRAVADALAEAKMLHAREPEPDLVSVAHVRRHIEVSPSWLKARIASGELAKYGRGRLARVRLDDVRALLARRAGPVSAPSPSSQADRILAAVTGGRR
jgi:hypothetical protein